MRKYLGKKELLWYINLILLLLVLNDRCSGLASAYDWDQNGETCEMDDYVNSADSRMDTDSRTAEGEMDTDEKMITDNDLNTDNDNVENSDYTAEPEQTVKDCFYAGNSKAAGSFQSQLSEEDYDCLLRIVEAEAGICDEKGKILVANVVLNRMETTEFPDTVREVVYQDHQFSPVSSGRIDRVTVTDETVEAVRKALDGTDYSEGALFFVARKHAEQKNLNWFDNSLEFLFEHDGHEFFKCKNQ